LRSAPGVVLGDIDDEAKPATECGAADSERPVLILDERSYRDKAAGSGMPEQRVDENLDLVANRLKRHECLKNSGAGRSWPAPANVKTEFRRP
jgi:hypothetical protein